MKKLEEKLWRKIEEFRSDNPQVKTWVICHVLDEITTRLMHQEHEIRQAQMKR